MLAECMGYYLLNSAPAVFYISVILRHRINEALFQVFYYCRCKYLVFLVYFGFLCKEYKLFVMCLTV